jgi:hypothetical protein
LQLQIVGHFARGATHFLITKVAADLRLLTIKVTFTRVFELKCQILKKGLKEAGGAVSFVRGGQLFLFLFGHGRKLVAELV